MTLSELFLIFIFLGFSAFLSLSEIALVGISKVRLRHMVDRNVPRSKWVQGLIAQIEEVITTILVASNFINAALTSIVTATCIVALGERWGVVVSSVVAGSMILLLTDIVPKLYASRHADQVSLRVALPMRFLVFLFKPVGKRVTQLSYAVMRLFGITFPGRSPLITEEEMKIMIEMGKEEGVFGEHERMMLSRIFEFGDLAVKDVMVPRERMVVVAEKASHDEVLQVLTEEGHSRIPVYRDSPDKITGIIYVREILHILREGWLIVLEDIIHPPFEVPPESRVNELLQEFQKKRLQMAIVVDAAGRALGLVTLEDLIEEIVGEIHEKAGG